MVYYLKKPSLKWESPYNKEEMGQDNISGQKYTFFTHKILFLAQNFMLL